MAKYGRAAITWTSTEDSNTQRVFLLDVPLHDVTPAHTLATYYAESLDRTKTATVTIGTGAYELEGKIRYASNPTGLLDVIKAGSQGKTLTYVPDLADPAVKESVILIGPRSPADVALDQDRGFRGEAQVTLRFRRTDQKASPSRPRGGDVLFEYHAGDSLANATFARTTGATYPSVASTADFGYGTLTTAAANKARVGWFSSASSVGPRTIPGLLLEPARTNYLKRSYQFTNSTWTATDATVTTGQADPAGGTKASLVADNSTTATGTLHGFSSGSASTFVALSWFMKAGTTVKGSRMSLRTIGGTTLIGCNVTWSSGRPTAAYSVGVSAQSPERYRNGWYRFASRTSAVTSTSQFRVTLTPASTGAGVKGNVYVYGFQVES